MLDPSRAAEALAADVVVGVASDDDPGRSSEAALALQAGLRAAYPGRTSLAVVLSAQAAGTLEPGATLVPGGEGRPPPVIHAGAGPEAALHALLEVASDVRAPACALLEPMPRPADPGWLRGSTATAPFLCSVIEIRVPAV